MTLAAESLGRRLCHTRLRDLLRLRIDGRLDWRRLVADAGLADDLAEVVVDTVRRTRLWRREKVEVARELVAHFQDGLDAKRSPAELLASFGDRRLAARLTRRAKRRCRPWWWHAWRWCCWTVAALLAVWALWWLRAWWSRPSVNVDYVARLNARALALSPDQAAWPLYSEALEELGRREGRLPPGVDWPNMPAHALDDDFARFADEHADTLERIRTASRRPGFGLLLRPSENTEGGLDEPPKKQRLPGRVLSIRLEQVDALRALLIVLLSDARRAAAAGDGDTATQDLLALLGISRQLQETPFLVSGMVGIAINGAVYDHLALLIRKYPTVWTDDRLQRLAHAVAAAELDWRRWLEGERAMMLDVVQRLYTDDGAGDGHITSEGISLLNKMTTDIADEIVGLSDGGHSMPQARRSKWQSLLDSVLNERTIEFAAMPLLVASRRDLVDRYERIVDQTAQNWSRPLWEAPADRPELDLEKWSKTEMIKYYPLVLLLPATEASHRAIENSLGCRDGATIGLALELWRRHHGAWPASLDELSPRYLPRLPVDRLSGRPLRYRIVDDRPVVYSLGVDGDDDGGQPPAGRNGNHYASPGSFLHGRPATDEENNGDWILWGAATTPED